jgi:flagellar assembly factor FliW
MKIQTSRFGEIEIAPNDILEFAEGLLGFGHLRKFVLLDDPNDEIFAWLQSCDNAGTAFPVLEPELFMPTYKVEPSKSDIEALQIQNVTEGRLLTIITIPVDPTQMTANMKAPIVLNPKKRLARQCILQDNSLQIREPIFTMLQKRVVQHPGVTLKPTPQNMGTVRLNRPGSEAEV